MSRIWAKRDETSVVKKAQYGREGFIYKLLRAGFLFFIGINSGFFYAVASTIHEGATEDCGPVLENANTVLDRSLQIRLFEIRVALNCFFSSIQGLSRYEFLEATKVFVNHVQPLLDGSFENAVELTRSNLQTSQLTDLKMIHRSLRFLERVSTLIKTARYHMTEFSVDSRGEQSLIVLTKEISLSGSFSPSDGLKDWFIHELSSLNSESLVVFGIPTHTPVKKSSKDKILEFLEDLQSISFEDLSSSGASQRLLGLLRKTRQIGSQREVVSSAGNFLETQVYDFFEPFLILFEAQIDFKLRRILYDTLNQLIIRAQGFLAVSDPYFSSLGLKNFFGSLLSQHQRDLAQVGLSSWDDVQSLSRLVRDAYQGQAISLFKQSALIFPPIHMTDYRRASVVFLGQSVTQEVLDQSVAFLSQVSLSPSKPGEYDVIEEFQFNSNGFVIYLRSGQTNELRSIRIDKIPGSIRFRLVPALEYLFEKNSDGMAPVGRRGRYVS